MAESPYRDRRVASVYERGNDYSAEALRAWVERLGSYGPPLRNRRILDVGAGTGMFTSGFARWLAPRIVVAVEPSAAMIDQAPNRTNHGIVHYVSATATALPVASHQFSLVLLSRVIHHLGDRAACAREVARVLGPAGRVVVRTTVRERLDALVYDYFPTLKGIDRHRSPAKPRS